MQNLDKYLNLLKNTNFQIEILNSTNSTAHSGKEFTLNLNVKNFLIKLSTINIDSLSIKEAYSIIENITIESQQLIKEFNNE